MNDASYLWLTRFPPYPPQRGGAIDYSRSLIESLSARGEVLVLAYEPDEAVAVPASPTRSVETVRHAMPAGFHSLVSPLPNVASRNVDPAYLKRAVALAAGKTAVFVDFIAMAWLVEPLAQALSASDAPPIIMVTHNHEHAVRTQMVKRTANPAMRAVLALDAWKAGRLERRANAAASGVTAITVTDRDAFARDTSTPGITLPPAYEGPLRRTRTIDAAVPRRAVILGNRDSHHKMMVLDRTLQALAAAGTEKAMTVDLAGSGDIAGAAARFPGFVPLGFVPDLAAYLDTVRLGLMTDDIGGGFKIRAMSYAMLRVPILAVREAMHGMEFEEGVHYIAVDTLPELARRAASLIDDLATLNRVQEAAFIFASERFDAAEPGRRLSAFADRLAGRTAMSVAA
jgi:polysaccharide biosynthesis protein PslH